MKETVLGFAAGCAVSAAAILGADAFKKKKIGELSPSELHEEFIDDDDFDDVVEEEEEEIHEESKES